VKRGVGTEFRPVAVQARLERAQRHVNDLERIISEYLDRPPYRIVRRTGDGARVIDRAELVEEPPIEAAMIVSDAVHQARAALDNLANALRPDGPTSGIEFPIRSTEAAYRKAVSDGALRGVPAWAREAIEAVQPFSTDLRRWAGRELANLHELARVDRHRLPPIHAAFLLPDSASADDLSEVRFRVDRAAWRWAEWEYPSGDNTLRVHFRVDVQFGPDSGQPPDVEVAGWTAYLVRSAADAVDMVLRSAAAG
jgi:hypothetical protein